MRLMMMGAAMGLALGAVFVFSAAVRAGDGWIALGIAAFIAACFLVAALLEAPCEEVIQPMDDPRTYTVRHRSRPNVRVAEPAE